MGFPQDFTLDEEEEAAAAEAIAEWAKLWHAAHPLPSEQQPSPVAERGDEQPMSSVRGVHIPSASGGAVNSAKKPKLAEKKSGGGKGGKPQTAKPFPGAAPPFKKGGKRK